MWNPFKYFNNKTETRGADQEFRQTPEITFNSLSALKGLSDSISADAAMKFTAVFCAMRLRAEAIGSLPKTVRVLTKNGVEEAKDHPVYNLLKYEPNSYMNVFNFWEFINTSLDGWGNSYVIIFRKNDGTPEELIPIHPSKVTVTLKNRKKWFRISGTNEFDGVFSDDDILHFFSLSTDGIKGINPILYNAEAINSGISATRFGREFFENGGNLKGVYESPSILPADKYKIILDRLSNLPTGSTPILEGGMTYKSIGIQPEAAQMLETRTFAVQDIARIFNLPPHMLFDLSRATFSNIEHQDIQVVKYSIRPPVKRFEMELDRKLFFTKEQGIYHTKMNLEGLLRGDSKTRYENYQKAILSGWMSRNEVREIEGLNQADGLSEFIYPSNMNINSKEND